MTKSIKSKKRALTPFYSFYLLLSICFSSSALASHQLTLTPLLYAFDYSEYSQTNIELNNENGLLPGLAVQFETTRHNHVLRLHSSVVDGEVDYDGRTQGGTAHTTDTETQLFTLGLRLMPAQLEIPLQRIFLSDLSSILQPPRLFIGLQYWRWDRDILTRDNVQGLHEIYSWYELELGLQLKSAKKGSDPQRPSWYWAELSALYNVNPQMKILLPNSEVNLKLGSQAGARLRFGRSWQTSPTLLLSLSLFAEYWEFGRSNTELSNDFFGRSAYLTEPRSETLHSGITLDFAWRF
ncbi:MAG TPA: hypothetical protein VIQ81_09595 [Gammaproteobacteria bacterium]